MPATRIGTTGEGGGETATPQEVMVFGGIIDILQIYGARKKLEHQYKSIRYRNEREGISVTDPAVYSARMVKFLLSKFIPSSSPEHLAASDASGGGGDGDGDGGEGSGGGGGDASTSLDGAVSISRGTSLGRLGKPLLVGKLEKKGKSFPFVWSTRYCEFFAASRTLLYYYGEQEKIDQKPPRGQRQLRSLSRVGAGSSGTVLAVLVASESKERDAKEKLLLLRFSTPAERNLWHLTLKDVIGEEEPLYTSTSFSRSEDGVASAI